MSNNLAEAFVSLLAGEDARCEECEEFFMHCECLVQAHEEQLREYEKLCDDVDGA